MRGFFLAIIVSTSAVGWADTLIYEGQSTYIYNGKNDCTVSLDLDRQKQIQAIDYAGPVETFEIIADTPTGYKPKKEIYFSNHDELLADPQTFARLDFQNKPHYFSDGFTLKSRQSIEGPLGAAFDIEFNKNNGKLDSILVSSKYKAGFLTVASKKFNCHKLTQKR